MAKNNPTQRNANRAAGSPAADAPGAVKNYTVITPVTHDQEFYDPGETIELDEDTAAPLLKVNAIAAEGGADGVSE